MHTINQLKQALKDGSVTARSIVEEMIGRIEDPAGQGDKVYVTRYATQARVQADAIDSARQNRLHLSPFAGIPISIKDLFDVAGEVTTAGSHVLDENRPAHTDAAIVARLRRAGFVLMGKVNMTEFAYSGMGINEHYGTPLSSYDRTTGRIPGGSSSGGAVSVADQMAVATIGTDTGGSCRIPAAFNGIVGFKPTASRVPKDGVIPLSTTLDSVGPLANSVSCAAILDDILAGGSGDDVPAFPVAGLRLGVLQSVVLENLDQAVATTYEQSLNRLASLGAELVDFKIDELAQIPASNPKGALVAAEAYAWHRKWLESREAFYDSFVKNRLLGGRATSAADYIDMLAKRQEIIAKVRPQTAIFDAVIMPAVAIIPPTLKSLQDPVHAGQVNGLILRNTSIGNYLDRTAITIPCHHPGLAPVGLMLMGENGADRRLLAIAKGIEASF
ncbi:MAG: aspartyl-tRNA(Asn)/glutamyl-tRNA(Gln) amidotransferase subunit A [Cellvibrionaceae bacterium]|jgi:aspartyl-tRNA(Asn)/glutamyl-tRNA(Gln) amidotransferase subunit A